MPDDATKRQNNPTLRETINGATQDMGDLG